MNKIEDKAFKKAYNGKIIGVVFGVAMLIAAALVILFGKLSTSKIEENPVYFSDAYADQRLKEDLYVFIDVAEDPILIGYYNDSEQYYYAFDKYDEFYIIECSKSEYEKICSDIKTDSVAHVEGSIDSLSTEVLDNSFDYLNDGNANPWTRETFDSYFMGVGLDVNGQVGYFNICLVLGGLLAVIGAVLLLSAGIELHHYNTFQKSLSDTDLAAINGETESPMTVYHKAVRTYLTPHYILSYGNTPVFVRYADILWAYKHVQKTNGVTTLTNITIVTSDHKSQTVADKVGGDNCEAIFNNILATIMDRNPNTLIGYSDENKNYINNRLDTPTSYSA